MWTLENLLRLSHSAACAELSDLARSSASTYGEQHAIGGELVESAERLVAAAEQVRLLAVAVERQRGASWETIGEVLAGGISKQAAQARFGDRVDELVLDVLLPRRDGPTPEGLRWSAGPDVVLDADKAVARLDEWAARHHERTDPGREHVDELVSHGLRERLLYRDGRSREATNRIATVTLLANLIMEATGAFATRKLPPGVTAAAARRRLLEEKVALYDAMRREARTPQALQDALDASEQAWDALVDWHRADVRERLGHTHQGDVVLITLDGRPVQALERTDDPVDDEVRGWWRWNAAAPGPTPDDPGLDVRILRAARDTIDLGPGEFVADVDIDEKTAIAVTLDAVCDHIATDAAKGFGPFAPGGIAGPPTSA